MKLLHEIVVERIASKWSLVADYLGFEIEYKDLIKQTCNQDPQNCCVKMLEDWLGKNKGVSPKSWSKLIETLREIKALTATTEKIVNDLKKREINIEHAHVQL